MSELTLWILCTLLVSAVSFTIAVSVLMIRDAARKLRKAGAFEVQKVEAAEPEGEPVEA